MITYNIRPNCLKTFSVPGKPFLSFDQFLNVVQWYRDEYYAADNVRNFGRDVGTAYNVWTRKEHSVFHRHIFFDQIKDDVELSFEVPHLDRSVSFPLVVRMFDKDGLYFENHQELVVERFISDRFVLTSWRKVPTLSDFLFSEVIQWPVAA